MTATRARFDALLTQAVAEGATDLHLVPGQAPRLRVGGGLRPHGEAWAEGELRELAEGLFGPRRLELQATQGVSRLALGLDGGRFARVSLASTRGRPSLAVRLRKVQVHGLEECDVPPQVGRLLEASHGLILVTGPHGSGKTTTLYALVEELNRTRPLHVCTVEDPVEIVLEPKQALLQQREVGSDVPDTAAGVAAAMDQDLDVLMVGELPDLESLSACLHAAETGHLVLVQVHADDPWDAVARLVEAAPESMQGLVRRTLAATLLGVTTQRLVPAKDRGRRAAVGVLVPDDAFRAALAAGGSVAGLAGGPESRTVREALAALEERGAIAPEAAAEARAALGRG